MKKTLVIAGLMAWALGAFAEDSYLYWLVGDTIEVDGTTYDWSSGNLTTRVVAYDSSNNKVEVMNLYSVDKSGGLTTLGTTVLSDGDNSAYYAGIASGMTASNWSYFIELYNDSNVFVGRSAGDGLNYATAQSADYLRKSGFATPGNTWAVTAFTAAPVPEPTSGLLLLLGGALLALRRKRI